LRLIRAEFLAFTNRRKLAVPVREGEKSARFRHPARSRRQFQRDLLSLGDKLIIPLPMRNVSCQMHDQPAVPARLFASNRRGSHPRPAARTRFHFEVEIQQLKVLGRAKLNAAATGADSPLKCATVIQDFMTG
jgi:hypothetical protein